MDDVVNRMARELSDAIAAAVAEDARVEACRERARAFTQKSPAALDHDQRLAGAEPQGPRVQARGRRLRRARAGCDFIPK